MTLRNSWVKYNLEETGYSQQTNDVLYHDEILRLEICLYYETFVVLSKSKVHCGNMGGASEHLQKYFIDKLHLHSVTAQIRLSLCASV